MTGVLSAIRISKKRKIIHISDRYDRIFILHGLRSPLENGKSELYYTHVLYQFVTLQPIPSNHNHDRQVDPTRFEK